MIQRTRLHDLHDLAPGHTDIRDEVLRGLLRQPKELPPKLFYDARGSQLFDQITTLPEYYPTRTEMAIMQAQIGEMADLIGPGCLLIEYGSGSSLKTRLLLDRLPAMAGYVPVDISREHLLHSAAQLAARYPALEILPVCADYTEPFSIPMPAHPVTRVVVYFPGSTIGNAHPPAAAGLLRQIGALAGPGGGLLIGVDLIKDYGTLNRAYNDSQGVTAAFNLNVLARINRELGAGFQLNQFHHDAFYNVAQSRIEMHLISQREQTVQIGDTPITIAAGERILTECSYKYSRESFAALAEAAGLTPARIWTDPEELFSVQFLTA